MNERTAGQDVAPPSKGRGMRGASRCLELIEVLEEREFAGESVSKHHPVGSLGPERVGKGRGLIFLEDPMPCPSEGVHHEREEGEQ